MRRYPSHLVLLQLLLLTVGELTLLAQTKSATMEVDASTVANLISPGLYGQFVEVMFGGVEGSLWDELIRNRSFEEPPNEIGLSRDWEREPDNRNHDPAVQFHWSDSISYPEISKGHSMRIDVDHNQWDVAQRRGISQSKISVQDGKQYVGYVWLKSKSFDGYLTVALEQDRTDGQTYSSFDLHPKSEGWMRYPFALTSSKTDPLAKFSILTHGTGTIWIDQVSLIPGDAIAGTGQQVFQKIEDLRPAFIRWPGGNVAQNYRWMRGVGPKDSRPSWTNHAWWNEIESSDFGTDEYIQLCHALRTEPSITVNMEGDGASAQEAANWVEYTNGSPDTKFGAMRAANGHPEPYHVKYWEVGNEVFGKWEIGHTDASTYANNFNRYAAAMRAVDPNIHLIAVGNDLDWNRKLLEVAEKNIDLIAIHFYYGEKEMQGDSGNLLAHPVTLQPIYDGMRKMLRQYAPDNHVRLTVNEWNTSLPVPTQHTMISAVYAGSMLNQFERNGDIVGSSAVSDLVNGWSGGIIQASRDELFVTPIYLVNKLYSDHLGTARLASSVQGPVFDTTLEGKGVPLVDAIATRSTDGTRIFLKAVNKDLRNSLLLNINIEGLSIGPHAEFETITAGSATLANSFTTPTAIAPQKSMLPSGNHFAVELPRGSVSILTLNIANPR